MEITCPDCGARYEVAAAMVPAGRTVRCARCGTNWMPLGHRPDSTPPRPVPTAAGLKPLGPIPQPETTEDRLGWQGMTLPAAWAASIALLLAIGWSLLHWRTAVAHAWPPAHRLYTLLGVPVRR